MHKIPEGLRADGPHQGRMLTSAAITEAALAAGLDPVAVVVSSLDADRTPTDVRVDPEHPFYPASMLKTPLAAIALADVSEGRLGMDQRFACTPENMTTNDKPSPLVPGYSATVAELLELMITISDNVATNMFFDILGRERATEIAQTRFGLARTGFYRKLSGSEPLIVDPGWNKKQRNTHPASDAAKLFTAIARDEVPHANELREILGRQQFNDKLSAGLREGDRFFHKTGSTDEVTHDGGILETAEGRSYVVVVYTGLEANDRNDARFGPFMKALRPLL